MVFWDCLTVRDDETPVDTSSSSGLVCALERSYKELLIGDNFKVAQHPRIMKVHEYFTSWPALSRCVDALLLAVSVNDAPYSRFAATIG